MYNNTPSLCLHCLLQNVICDATPQEKFAQISRELPQAVGAGCEVRVKGLGYSVQRAKGTADEPTVGDIAWSFLMSLVCVPCVQRCRHGTVSNMKCPSLLCGTPPVPGKGIYPRV